tara:strand:+ start:700 stop:1035 length:336 start_codon:yes stop_codon:yes gene_type:complete
MSKIIEKLPSKPAKPLNGLILIKRTVDKDPNEKEKRKNPKQAHEEAPFKTEIINEVYSIGINEEAKLPFKLGDKVNIVTYGNEIVTAEEDTGSQDICYIILEPNKVVGLYE